MEPPKEEKKTGKKRSVLRLFAKILLGVILFLILLIFFIRSPWGQGIIVDRVVSFISKKTNTTVEVEHLFITFSGDILLEGLYMEDEAGDSLLYSRSLQMDIPIWPIIRGEPISIDNLVWSGVRANIIRTDSVEGFNYQFLIDAFTPADTLAPNTPQDTAVSGNDIFIGDITINDFQLDFKDKVAGLHSTVELGGLEVEMQEFSLEKMEFKLGDVLLQDTRVKYVQSKPLPVQPNKDKEAAAPTFSLKSLRISNVKGNYESIPGGLHAIVDIDEFILELPKADLPEKQVIVERLGLRNSSIALFLSSTPGESTVPSEDQTQSTSFTWPQWNVVAEEISLADNHLQFSRPGDTLAKGVFDPNFLDIRDINFQANHMAIREGFVEAYIQKLNFKESSGLILKNLNFDLNLTDESLRLTNLDLHLNDNRIKGQLLADFSSLSDVLETPKNASLDLSIPKFSLDLQDLLHFQPGLGENGYLVSLRKKRLYGKLNAKGRLSEIRISNARLHWGTNTLLAANGILNIADPEALYFKFPQFRATTVRTDLLNFVNEKELGITLPGEIEVTGQFSGSPEDILVNAQLISSAGEIELAGRFVSEPVIAFGTDLKVRQLQVGELLQNADLGPLNLQLHASGSGATVNDLDAVLNGYIESFTYNQYDFTNLGFSGELEAGEGYINMDYRDKNLDMTFKSFVELDSVSPKVAGHLNLSGADLQALGLSQRAINAAVDINATFEGNANSFDFTANVSDGIAVYNNENYLLGDIELLAHVREDTTSLEIMNRMLDLQLRSSANPAYFIKALNRHYQSYFSNSDGTDTIGDPVNLELFTEVRPSPVLNEVMLPQLEEFDTIRVNINFREKEKRLTANIQLPYLEYFGSQVDSLELHLDSNKDKFTFDFGLDNFNAGPLAIKQTSLTGRFSNNLLSLDLESNFEGQRLVNIQSELSKSDGILRIHFRPDTLVLNSFRWSIHPQNQISVMEDALIFKDFVLERDDQLLQVSNEMAGIAKEHIGLEFENFELASILSYLNPEDVLASGELNGEFIIEEPFGPIGMLADLQIKDFAVMDVPMGVMAMNARATGSSRYEIDLAIREGNADLELSGSYTANEETAKIDLDIDLNEIKTTVIEGFFPEMITNSAGSFSGNISVTGTTAAPQYEGILHFKKTGFTVVALNAPFVFPDETLQVNNEGILLDDFGILDKNNNELVLDGTIMTENLFNPEFNLDFSAENFTALDATAEDNELVYGTAVFDAVGSLRGTLEVPQIEMDLDIREETSITYVIPKASLGIEERDGVVVFVNREDPDNILTQTGEATEKISFSGMQLSSYISLEKNATFTVVLDQETGDRIQGSGEGDLVLDIYPNGRTTLSGRLDINDGYYEMNLYELVNRRFDIMDGSSIVWSGDPYNADLDITAVYRVEASAWALMAPQITSVDLDVRQRFRQELPFLVYLNIDGELIRPKLSFGLDMPEDDQGAIGGQVYGRIQQINQQENELNKQVFSLLVLNRFFPGSGSDGSAGGTLSFARDNLNQALSDQLNLFSDRLLGETGINLKFGLDTFTDYQGESPQERTLLNISAQKSLMDDRLIVSVGSEVDLQGTSPVAEPSPVIGNVSIEYLLTQNGRFRLKAFRRKSFENVIDGQLIISGLSLIFTQEFNKFNELWKEIVNAEKKEKESKVINDKKGAQ